MMSYFKIALRNLRRYSAQAILNITGMAIGMTCAFLILLWIKDETSYDRFHKNACNLFRVIEHQPANGTDYETVITRNALAAALREEFPDIVRSSRYLSLPIALKKENEYISEVVATVDKDFPVMFNLKFILGDPKIALSNPHNIIITEKMAGKYFKDENPLGKALTSVGFLFTVTGVVKSMPENSHIQFDFLVPFEFLADLGIDTNEWEYGIGYTYVELSKGSDSRLVNNKIKDIIKSHATGSDAEISLQNIRKIHLFSSGKYAKDIEGNGNITYVRILGFISFIILLIACINYMNLSTAQSAGRAKEIGIRRVTGAGRRKIIIQFLGESFLFVFVAHIVAMILVELLLPGFNNLTGKHLAIKYWSSGLYLGLIFIVLITGLLAGSYPAFYLSGLKPLNTVRGIIIKNPGNNGLRRFLVISQFSLSFLLIIFTTHVGSQLRYIHHKNLGLNLSNVGYFQFSLGLQQDLLKTDLMNNHDIQNITFTNQNILNIKETIKGINWEGKKSGDDVIFNILNADSNYISTFQPELKAGRFFSNDFPNDFNSVVINEEAAEIMGFKDPVGKIISAGEQRMTIIGVLRNFHFKSLRSKIEPLLITMKQPSGFFCYIRIKSGKINSAVESVSKFFKSCNLPYPLDFKLIENDYNNLYQSEQKLNKILNYFSFLAILISCLGLIGLCSFMTERKTKEIGIRKTNGAKSVELFIMLAKEHLELVIAAFFIASPLAWYTINRWLKTFAYRTEIDFRIFLYAGTGALTIALLIVSYQSYRAARKNPVDALRYE